MEQLTELLTNYGEIHEVWFDGANGEGPNGRRQTYDWPTTFGLVKRLQPASVIFSDAGPDLRWIGNERGTAGDPNWSTVKPELVPYPGVSGPGVIEALQHGNPDGTVWRPGETDVSIRPGWFYHPAEDDKVRSVENLAELYFTSVGRNSKLLLNVPPTRDGLLHDTDVARLRGMREHLDGLFAVDLSRNEDLGRRLPISVISLREDISRGQSVARYEVMGSNGGQWISLSKGTTIGYRKLDRIAPMVVQGLKVLFHEALRPGQVVRIEAY